MKHKRLSISVLAAGLGFALAGVIVARTLNQPPEWWLLTLAAVLIAVGIVTADLSGPRDPK